jgi:hypothetical protein
MIRLDTMPLFESLQRVLGNAIMVGLRMPTPAAPVMRALDRPIHRAIFIIICADDLKRLPDDEHAL